MYRALYREWRPQVFEDVIGQEHITRTLTNAIKSGRISHAYLFCGIRGTGKTSTAKIFAKALNCVNGPTPKPCNVCNICEGINQGILMDVIEIDAASNRGIDEIRELRDKVGYPPTQGKYKVYIIDEVHMLTTEAFNALLKTLEEPPKHVVFILATTEPHKLPATILSRCQRFDFKRLSTQDILGRLKIITNHYGIEAEDEALRIIARNSRGAMRDALSVLDQCMLYTDGRIDKETVFDILGTVNDEMLFQFAEHIRRKDTGGILKLIGELSANGKDLHQFVNDIILHFRNMMIVKVAQDPEMLVDLSDEALKELEVQSKGFSIEKITRILGVLSETERDVKWSSDPQTVVEVAAIKLILPSLDDTPDAILERLSQLEGKVKNADFSLIKNEHKDDTDNKEDGELKGIESRINDKTIEEIQDLWPKVLEIIKKDKISLYFILVEAKTKPVNIKGNVLEIGFWGFEVTKQKAEKDRTVIEKAVNEVYKKAYRLAFVLLDEEDDLAKPKIKDKPAPQQNIDDAIKKAYELFDAEIIKVIDEK
ncbi:MAG: polymerase subunit gamma/tau [Thermosediminibacterales bacterium]|nr:polymerase subunit gamma/tau [Thermosediminibacterales bacterium]MDK2836052.1 polymerase subunit gamma/tau [Thermosediminibacterales bacterium]